jgi:hypothetical protein
MFSLPLSSYYAINYQGPLVVNNNYIGENGNIITGNFQGTLTQPAISVTTTTPVTIINSNVTGPGDLIYAAGANITVLNTKGIATNPNVANVQKGMFVHVEGAINVKVENCSAEGVRFGVYINRYSGNFTHNNTVKILNNLFTNIDARPSDGNGGYVKNGSWNSHAIQLNAVRSGVPNMEIAWNEIVNTPFNSQSNDLINIYGSNGTAASHLLIHDNYAQGAYPAKPGVDTGYSGGGIITDGNATQIADTTASYIDIYNNQVVSTSNYGIAIAAGHDIALYNNRVVSSGFVNGIFISKLNAVGAYNWNCYNQPSTVFFNNHVHDNYIGLISKNSSGSLFRNDVWLPGQNYNLENNLSFQPNNAQSPSATDEANEYKAWQKKFKLAHKTIGAVGRS